MFRVLNFRCLFQRFFENFKRVLRVCEVVEVFRVTSCTCSSVALSFPIFRYLLALRDVGRFPSLSLGLLI